MKRLGNSEPIALKASGVPLAARGSPERLAKNVHQVIDDRVREHSVKPDEMHKRVERLFPGPYLELFARQPRDGWTTWGDEIEATSPADAPIEGGDEDSRRMTERNDRKVATEKEWLKAERQSLGLGARICDGRTRARGGHSRMAGWYCSHRCSASASPRS
jgi:hypothetical protein